MVAGPDREKSLLFESATKPISINAVLPPGAESLSSQTEADINKIIQKYNPNGIKIPHSTLNVMYIEVTVLKIQKKLTAHWPNLPNWLVDFERSFLADLEVAFPTDLE